MSFRHGTGYAYGEKKCRCDICVEANSQRVRSRRARAKAEGRPSYFRELRLNRERKERYRGTCIVCGYPTSGADGPAAAPQYCVQHHPRLAQKALRGTGPVQDVTLAFLADGPKHFMEICRALGKPKGAIGPHLLRLMKYGLVERPKRGVYALKKS